MGCGASTVHRKRHRQRYHGVAASIAMKDDRSAGSATTASSAVASQSSDCSDVSDFEGSIYEGDDDILVRAMRKEGRRERRNRREKTKALRQDRLMNFGAFRLRMVDELACGPSGWSSNSSGAFNKNSAFGKTERLPSQLSTQLATSGLLQHSIPGNHPVSFSPGRFHHLSTYVSNTGLKNSRRNCIIRQYGLIPYVGHPRRIKFVLLSPTEKLMFSCAVDSDTVTAHHLLLKQDVGRLVGHDDAVLGGDISPDGSLVATVSRDATLILWDATTCKMRESFLHPKVVFCCRFCPKGKYVVTACQDHVCRVWSLDSGREVYSFTEHRGLVLALAFSSDAMQILSGGSEKHILVWGMQKREVSTFNAHLGGVISIAAQRGENNLIVSADERVVLVWSLYNYNVLISCDVSLASFSTVSRGAHGLDARMPSNPALKRHARKRLYWTTACFGPSTMENHVVLTASNNALYVYACDASVYDESTNKSTMGHETCSASHRHTNAVGSVPSVAVGQNVSPQSTNPSCVGEVLALMFPSPLHTLCPGAVRGVATGDSFGNTFLLNLE